jgi:hypothetical protein
MKPRDKVQPNKHTSPIQQAERLKEVHCSSLPALLPSTPVWRLLIPLPLQSACDFFFIQ